MNVNVNVNVNMNNESLDGQVKSLSFTFKSNLGTFLSKVQQQANAGNSKEKDSSDIESLLTDLDRVISNQKQLSELIQNGTEQIKNILF